MQRLLRWLGAVDSSGSGEDATNDNEDDNDEAAAAELAASEYLRDRVYVLQVVLLVGYATMCALCVLLLGYMRYNRSAAFKGDSSAARKVILPAFEPLLWLLGATTGAYSIFVVVALRVGLYETEISRVAIEGFYAGRQFVLVLVLVFMMQQSVSRPALLRAVAIAVFLSTYTVPIVWYVASRGDFEQTYEVMTASRALLLLLYTFVLVRPPSRASKRVLREYCLFAYAYFALLFAYNEMFHQNRAELGFRLTYANVSFGALCPLVIWRVLRTDTEHWRGLGQRACRLQTLYRHQQLQQLQQQQEDKQRQRPYGKNRRRKQPWLDENISSERIHDLIEMHRRYLIDFAYLELRQRIGVGASAVVFRGLLRSKTPVAVKVYTPIKYDEATVAAFSHEAALCGALNRHPNIVRFYGLCVSPPTICLVSELCLGSLEDVSRAMDAAWRQKRKQTQGDLDKVGKTKDDRQRLLLALCQMLDAARAVAYLHSFSPPFLHRDVKPANFLVDANGTVKLTDFGEARELPRGRMEATTGAATGPNRPEDTQQQSVQVAVAEQDDNEWITATDSRERSGSFSSPYAGELAFRPTDYEAQHSESPKLTVRGTVDYMAPEVINGRSGLAIYGEAADVYSLAITMWDILYPGREKYPTLRQNHLQIFEFVTEGRRPALPAQDSSDDVDDSLWVPDCLCDLIASGWHADPRLRPSAEAIVQALVAIQEELQAAFAIDLRAQLPLYDASTGGEDHAMETKATMPSTTVTATSTNPSGATSVMSSTFQTTRRALSFTGERIVTRMLECDYAVTAGEAIRLGNALMDAGLLHHTKHTSSFENSTRASYYIDDAKLCCLYQPSDQVESIAMLAPPYTQSSVFAASEDEEWTTSQAYSIESSTSSSSSLVWNSGNGRSHPSEAVSSQCACRKHGQRLDVAKSSKRRRKFHWHRRLGNNSTSGATKEAAGDCKLTAKLLQKEEGAFDDEAASTDFDAYADVAVSVSGEEASH